MLSLTMTKARTTHTFLHGCGSVSSFCAMQNVITCSVEPGGLNVGNVHLSRQATRALNGIKEYCPCSFITDQPTNIL